MRGRSLLVDLPTTHSSVGEGGREGGTDSDVRMADQHKPKKTLKEKGQLFIRKDPRNDICAELPSVRSPTKEHSS